MRQSLLLQLCWVSKLRSHCFLPDSRSALLEELVNNATYFLGDNSVCGNKSESPVLKKKTHIVRRGSEITCVCITNSDHKNRFWSGLFPRCKDDK